MSLWASALYDYGLSSKDFWGITPRQYDALADAHRRSLRHRDAMFCRLEAAIINFSMYPPKKAVTLDDLLPPDKPKRKLRGPSKKMLEYVERERLRMAVITHNAAVAAGRA